MEAEARELTRIMRLQMKSHILLPNGAVRHALAALEAAIADRVVEGDENDREKEKSDMRELARLRRLEGGAIAIDPVRAQLAAYDSEPGTL